MSGTDPICFPKEHSEVVSILRAHNVSDPDVAINFLYNNKNVDGVYERTLKGVRFSKGFGETKVKKELELPVRIADLVSFFTAVSLYKKPTEDPDPVLSELPTVEPPIRRVITSKVPRNILDNMYNIQHRITTIKRNRPPRRLGPYKTLKKHGNS